MEGGGKKGFCQNKVDVSMWDKSGDEMIFGIARAVYCVVRGALTIIDIMSLWSHKKNLIFDDDRDYIRNNNCRMNNFLVLQLQEIKIIFESKKRIM